MPDIRLVNLDILDSVKGALGYATHENGGVEARATAVGPIIGLVINVIDHLRGNIGLAIPQEIPGPIIRPRRWRITS